MRRVWKVGNDQTLNPIFEYWERCKFQIYGPIQECNNIVGYVASVTDDSGKHFMLQLKTSAALGDMGVGEARGSEACYLFQLDADYVFTVFVAEGLRNYSHRLFQEFKSGLLSEEIDSLLAQIPGLSGPVLDGGTASFF